MVDPLLPIVISLLYIVNASVRHPDFCFRVVQEVRERGTHRCWLHTGQVADVLQKQWGSWRDRKMTFDLRADVEQGIACGRRRYYGPVFQKSTGVMDSSFHISHHVMIVVSYCLWPTWGIVIHQTRHFLRKWPIENGWWGILWFVLEQKFDPESLLRCR